MTIFDIKIQETFNALQELAKQGDLQAQYNLGVAYAKGQGVLQDYTQTKLWFEKAADKGHIAAQNNW